MTLPVSNPTPSENTLIELTDKEIVVTLITFKYMWEVKVKKPAKTIFYYDRGKDQGKVGQILKSWQMGEPLPVPDIRDVFRAMRIFNSAVHDDF